MFDILKEVLKTILLMALVIVLTHSLFFIVFSYCVSGDPLRGLMNFYDGIYRL